MANAVLLRKVMDQIERDPSRWYQDSWRDDSKNPQRDEDGFIPVTCGTAFCFAGWAATMTGANWLSPSMVAAVPEDGTYQMVTIYGRNAVTVDYRATRVLGLNTEDASVLFAASNDIDDLRAMVELLVEGEHLEEEEDF